MKSRIAELEEALLDMAAQFSHGSENFLHSFMSAEENAYSLLGIRYGEEISEVYERFRKKWEQEEANEINELDKIIYDTYEITPDDSDGELNCIDIAKAVLSKGYHKFSEAERLHAYKQGYEQGKFDEKIKHSQKIHV